MASIHHSASDCLLYLQRHEVTKITMMPGWPAAHSFKVSWVSRVSWEKLANGSTIKYCTHYSSYRGSTMWLLKHLLNTFVYAGCPLMGILKAPLWANGTNIVMLFPLVCQYAITVALLFSPVILQNVSQITKLFLKLPTAFSIHSMENTLLCKKNMYDVTG